MTGSDDHYNDEHDPGPREIVMFVPEGTGQAQQAVEPLTLEFLQADPGLLGDSIELTEPQRGDGVDL